MRNHEILPQTERNQNNQCFQGTLRVTTHFPRCSTGMNPIVLILSARLRRVQFSKRTFHRLVDQLAVIDFRQRGVLS